MPSALRSDDVRDAASDHLLPRRVPLRRRALVGLARGAAGGVGATAAMSAVMLAAQKVGLMGELPPQKITDHILGARGRRARYLTPRPARRALAALNHFAFGATCGALFGVAREVWGARAMRPAPRLAAGLAFGTAVWALSYAGWVPAARIMPMPQRDRSGRPTSMVLAHWVFGGVIAEVVG
jgi:hypothetical protein